MNLNNLEHGWEEELIALLTMAKGCISAGLGRSVRFEEGQNCAVRGGSVSGEMCRATDGTEDHDT